MAENLEVKATSVDGISQMYGLGKATVRRAIDKGELRVSRVGRRLVIRVADAEKWMGASGYRKTARKA
jgi:excisionase family DNA binding protein